MYLSASNGNDVVTVQCQQSLTCSTASNIATSSQRKNPRLVCTASTAAMSPSGGAMAALSLAVRVIFIIAGWVLSYVPS